jgi:hypothetical protein
MIVPNFESQQQRRIWLYFLDLRLQYACVILFMGLVLAEWSLGKALLLLGLAWVVGALVVSMARPSDQELDDMLSLGLDPLVERAMQHLRPRKDEKQAPPLALMGPLDLNSPEYRQFRTRPRTGKDGRRRSPMNRVMVVVPLEDRLGIYSCHLDSLRNRSSQVSSEEHNYKDVVSIALEKDVEPSRSPAGESADLATAQILSIELTNGKHLSIPALVGRLRGDSGEEVPLTGLERTVRAIQTLIRDRR